MKYEQLRTSILEYVTSLQENQYSYQSMCDYINSRQTEFVLFKDFFSRFRSKPAYFRSKAKREKLRLIHQHLERFHQLKVGEADNIQRMLKKVISQAKAASFECFLEIARSPQSSLARLEEWYLVKSPAYLDLVRDLRQKEQYRWELDILNYGSTFSILSAQQTDLFSSSAIVKTKEFWKLCWVDKQTRQLQYRLESIGPQTYLLSKDQDGTWKIVENLKSSPANRIMPEYIEHARLKEMVAGSWEENREMARKLIADGRPLSCLAFLRTCFANELVDRQRSVLDGIEKSYLNSHRLLNTDAISYEIYKSERTLLEKQIQLLCDAFFLQNKNQ